MKKVIFYSVMMIALSSSANAYIGDVNCRDESGKVRISFHIDTTATDAIPQCIKQIKFDGEVVDTSIARFDDDGPIYQGQNLTGKVYAAKLKFGLKNIVFGYETEAVVQSVETTLHCR